MIKNLLSLSIILLSGIVHLSAHSIMLSSLMTSAKISEDFSDVQSEDLQYDFNQIIQPFTSTPDQNQEIIAPEVTEEEEFSVASLQGGISIFFCAIFQVLTLGYFLTNIKSRLTRRKRFLHFSSFRYLFLVFRSIRI